MLYFLYQKAKSDFRITDLSIIGQQIIVIDGSHPLYDFYGKRLPQEEWKVWNGYNFEDMKVFGCCII
mgnify:CR=1 FL=1